MTQIEVPLTVTVTVDTPRTGLVTADAQALKAIETGTADIRVVKATPERQFTLGVSYPSLKPDVGVAADGHRDAVRPETLEKAAWEWMTKHRNIGLHHGDEGTIGHATVVESYIWRGPDWTIPSPVDGKEYVVKAGDWMVGAIWDAEGWRMVKSGILNGWSPQGAAARQAASGEFLAQLRR